MAIAKDNNIDEMITRYLAGETSADEDSRMLLWIRQSDANRKRYNDLKKAFDLTTAHVEASAVANPEIDVDEEWSRFQNSIAGKKKTRHLMPSGVWLKIAASVLLVAVTGALLYLMLKPQQTIHQTASEKTTVILPDGSLVSLNRYTSLSYDADFGEGSRTLKLDGEAYFDVKPDATNPFIVLTENAKIQVIGTSFTIMAYDTVQAVEVVVETGIVSLEPLNAGTTNRVQLLPGEKGTVSKADDGVSIALNEDVNFLAWNSRHLVFVDSDLESVIRVLEKTYGARISIAANVPRSCVVTVTFDKQSLESVMRVLGNTLNLKYTIGGNKVLITEAGC